MQWPASSAAIKVAVASAIIGLIAGTPNRPGNALMDRLAQAAVGLDRPFEPRLAGGFPWAPLMRARRGDSDNESRYGLLATAGEVIRTSRGDPSADARHAAAIAYLIAGDATKSEASLEAIADSASEARTWNDLAVARYLLGLRDSDPSKLARALAAADAALRRDPALAEAYFNRALIIEGLGLRDLAQDAWNAYLRVDASSEWANEARRHVRNLLPPPVFEKELARNYDGMTRDPASARAFARRYREDARRWGETEILARWAAAELAGNRAEAENHLSLAREFGAELARDRGDRMLQELVAAIDRAGEAQRIDLVHAHLAFRDGQRTYKDGQPSRAERLFLDAAALFERGGSPGALLARYFAANTAYSQSHFDESDTRLKELIAAAPPQFIAHRAQVLWQIGLGHMAAARWGACIDALTESAALFEQLDERNYAARMHQSLGTAYDRIGSPAEAARHRMIALRTLGQQPSSRLQILLTSLSQTAGRNRDWPAAVSLFGLAIDVADRVNDPLARVSTLLLRARLRAQMQDRSAAADDLRAARAGIDKISEPAYRSFLEANATSIEAMLSEPATAIALLTSSIDFHRDRGRRVLLPELLLERGRAFLLAGDKRQAADDFEQGIVELESRRETLAPDARWGIFHDAEDLFDAAITLSLDRRDDQRAFEYAERARARTLLESLGAAWPAVEAADVPEDTAIVEYVVQTHHLVIFVVDHRGVRAVRNVVDRAALDAESGELVAGAIAEDRTRLRKAGRTVHRHLIEPIEDYLVGKATVVIVPDPRMGSLPFAALVDVNERFLIERFPIVVSPSAAAFLRLAHTPTHRGASKTLIVTGSEELGPLVAAEREAERVAAVYPRVTRLSRDRATVRAFTREAADAAVIHFAGHAVAGGQGAGLVLTREGAADGQFDLKEIASMRLDRTDVVVLAACSTAAGELRSTEGTISVARAFLAAGVPSVVATLWPIDDEYAAEFFPVIHRNLSRGLSPAEALRAAQLEWMQRADGGVALWTAVQLIGR